MMKKLLIALGLGWGALFAAGYGLAQDAPKEGDIPLITVTGEKKVVPVAVAYFQALGGSSDPRDFRAELRKLVADDLASTGLFKVIEPSTHLAKDTEGIETDTIVFADWFNSGAQLLIKTGFSLSDASLRLEGRLYEVSAQSGRLALNKTFSGDASDARPLAHLWANAIVKYFTGEDGIFNTRIAYTRKHRVKGRPAKNLYVIDYDGHGKRALTSNTGLNLLPRWAPGGAAILASTTMNRRWQIVRISLASSRPKILSSKPGLNLAGSYAPDGSSFLATLSIDGNSEVYLLSGAGEILRRLTDHWGIDSTPTFSPDGSRVAWVSDRSGSPQIYVMGADGSGQRRLTFRGSYNQEPDWSPKGDKIVFSGRDGRFDLFTIDVASGAAERLTQGAGNNEHPKWSPDGRFVVYSSTRKGGSRIYTMAADGTNPRALTNAGAGVYTPAWSPRVQ
jgi:TolB protein